jgi:hypothetical protein
VEFKELSEFKEKKKNGNLRGKKKREFKGKKKEFKEKKTGI